MLRSMPAIHSKLQSLVAEIDLGPDRVGGANSSVWAIAFCAVVAAAFALPSDSEIAYGLIGDKNYQVARAKLADIHAKGGGDIHSTIALHEIHLKLGDPEAAEKVIERAIETYPNDLQLLKSAARFYKNVQAPAKRLRILIRTLNISPSAQLLDEALQLLALYSNYEGEKSVLLNFADSSAFKARHHVRLGTVFAREQQYDLAVKHFMRADEISSEPNWRARMTLFRVLLLNHETSRSQSLVKAWMKDTMDRDTVAFFYGRLVAASRNELAREVLEEAAARGHVTKDGAAQISQGASG